MNKSFIVKWCEKRKAMIVASELVRRSVSSSSCVQSGNALVTCGNALSQLPLGKIFKSIAHAFPALLLSGSLVYAAPDLTGDNTAFSIGAAQVASGVNCIAIGGTTGTLCSGSASLAIGNDTKATGAAAIAIGVSAVAGDAAVLHTIRAVTPPDYSLKAGSSYSSTAVGANSVAKLGSTAIGASASAALEGGTAIGLGAQAGFYGSAFGVGAYAQADESIAIGDGAYSNGLGAIAAGSGSTATGATSVAIGASSSATGSGSIAIGGSISAYMQNVTNFTNAKGNDSIAVGYSAQALADNAVAIGRTSNAAAVGSIALGSASLADSDSNIAIGASASATGTGPAYTELRTDKLGAAAPTTPLSSTAVGYQSNAADGGTAYGTNTTATGGDSIALGIAAGATAQDSIAVGITAFANGQGAIAFGRAAVATGLASVAIGTVTTATGAGSIAIGPSASSTGARAVAIGTSPLAITGNGNQDTTNQTSATGADSLALGTTAQATKDNAVAIGKNATSSGLSAISIGQASSADSEADIALGSAATATGVVTSVTAVRTDGNGTSQLIASASSMAIGSAASAKNGGMAVGSNAVASGQLALAVGASASATGAMAIALGTLTTAQTVGAIAMGRNAVVTADNGVAIGNVSLASGNSGIAIGNSADAVGKNSIAIGASVAQKSTEDNVSQTEAKGDNALALGAGAKTDGAQAMALGFQAKSTAANSVAIGPNASVTVANSVALGAGSVASTGAQTSYTAYGLPDARTSVGEVSVGSPGNLRKITNVAAGSANSDVATVEQLQAIEASTQNMNGLSFNSTTGAWEAGRSGVATRISNVANGVADNDAVNYSQLNALDNKYTLQGGLPYDPTENNGAGAYDAEENGVDQKIANVADGVDADDAVNVRQLTLVRDAASEISQNGLSFNTTANAFDATKNGELAKITGVQDGELSATSTDAVTGRQLYNLIGDTSDTYTAENGNGVKYVRTNDSQLGPSDSSAQAAGATAIGYGAVASAVDSVAIGRSAQATFANSIALGANSVTLVGAQSGYTAYGLSAPQASAGELNIGNRQITGVAPGSLDTDAVNVAQLTAVANTVTTLINQTVQANSGSGNSGSSSGGGTSIDSGHTVLTANPGGAPIIFSNVAAGTADTDAVNVGQLNSSVNSAIDSAKAYADQRLSSLQSQASRARDTAQAGAASAVAIAGLPQASAPGKVMVAAAGSVYQNQAGMALGVSTMLDGGNWIVKGAVSTNSRTEAGAVVAAGLQW